jgi:hypothetical protein
MQYMNARPIVQAKEIRDDGSIVEIVIWELAAPLPPCRHHYKYRLFYGMPGACRVRYDNERGKGDHRHIGTHEEAYAFTTLETLLTDFEQDVANWRDT